MRQITHLTGKCYLEGTYQLRDLDSNWAIPVDCPTVFTAVGAGVKSGNWQSCTSINTPDYLLKYIKEQKGFEQTNSLYDLFYQGLTESESYELNGLFYAIPAASEAYNVFKHGNHGTHDGVDIKNAKAAKAIYDALPVLTNRANELILKIKGIHKPKVSN